MRFILTTTRMPDMMFPTAFPFCRNPKGFDLRGTLWWGAGGVNAKSTKNLSSGVDFMNISFVEG